MADTQRPEISTEQPISARKQMVAWVVVGGVILLLLGVGFTFMTSALPFHIWIADGCFIFAAILFAWRFWTWEDSRRQSLSLHNRMIAIAIIATIVITCGLVWANHYLNRIVVETARGKLIVSGTAVIAAGPPGVQVNIHTASTGPVAVYGAHTTAIGGGVYPNDKPPAQSALDNIFDKARHQVVADPLGRKDDTIEPGTGKFFTINLQGISEQDFRDAQHEMKRIYVLVILHYGDRYGDRGTEYCGYFISEHMVEHDCGSHNFVFTVH